MYNDKKWNQKNMKVCDKRKSHISSKLHMFYISSNNVSHFVTKAFTTLRPNTRNTASLHLSTLHFLSFKLHPTFSFGLTPFKFPTALFHLRSYTSPHFTSLYF
jgi:hypothetical protein